MEQRITIQPGDTVVIECLATAEVPVTPAPVEDLTVLLTVGGINIYVNEDASYVCFKSDLDVCTDGTGDHHGDKTPLDTTAYYNGGKYLNADVDRYIVVPPQIRSMVPGVVMGCKARASNLDTDVSSEAVTGEIGPETKTGECAICLAQILNPEVTANAGDSRRIYFYELWPDVAANVNGKQYKLEPA